MVTDEQQDDIDEVDDDDDARRSHKYLQHTGIIRRDGLRMQSRVAFLQKSQKCDNRA